MRASLSTLAVLLLLVALSACGGSPTGSPSPSATPPGSLPSEDPTASLPPRLSSAPTPGSSGTGAFDPSAVRIAFEVAVGGLESPLSVAHAGDGSTRLFVVEQVGRIRVVRDGTLEQQPFLDITDRVLAGGEQGLLGLAFHPEYPDDPRLFVNYIDRSGTTIVSSFAIEDDPDQAEAGSEVQILRIAQPYANHKGGAVAFGADGMLYIATGDGGSANDPHDNGQRVDTLLGKILRIDVDAGDGEQPYAIPADNPLLDDLDAEPEIWLTGLRNPWRMSFDTATGDLWIGDVGQGAWEEVNVARAGVGGLNFGWKRMEGVECFQDAGCEDPAYTLPVTEYDHSFGCSVVGGVVYRGTAVPGLAGGYLYADYCSGNFWVLDPSVEGRTDGRLVLDSGRSISAIGEDEAGEIFATDLNTGELLRIVAANG